MTNNKLFTIVEHTEGEQPAATYKCCDSLEFPVARSSLELGTPTLLTSQLSLPQTFSRIGNRQNRLKYNCMGFFY